jgi:hypothetical protein
MPLKPPTLQDLTCKVARQIGLSLKVLLSGTRDRKVSRARAIISYLAAKKAGYTQSQIAEHLYISRICFKNSIIRGQKMIDKCEEYGKRAFRLLLLPASHKSKLY